MDELKPQESEALDIIEAMLDVCDFDNPGPMFAGQHVRGGICKITDDDAVKLRQYIADRRASPVTGVLTEEQQEADKLIRLLIKSEDVNPCEWCRQPDKGGEKCKGCYLYEDSDEFPSKFTAFSGEPDDTQKSENPSLTLYDEIRAMSLEKIATFLSAGWNHADYEDGDWDPEIMEMLKAPAHKSEGSVTPENKAQQLCNEDENFIQTKFGYCFYTLNSTPFIYNLFVHPQYRRRGHSQMLLGLVINEIRKSGYKGEIHIQAEPKENSIGQADLEKYYESMGLTIYDAYHPGQAEEMNELAGAGDLIPELPGTDAPKLDTAPESNALITVEQVQGLYEFLQGKIPNNDAQKITFTKPPKVSKETAVDIIYYLQEVMHIIPDTFESCKKCGDFFDSDNDGCLAGFCECCGCQYPEFEDQEDSCVRCEESFCAIKPRSKGEESTCKNDSVT